MQRRIKIGDTANVIFRPTGKIIMTSANKPGIHLTINLGGRSGVWDAHETTEGESPSHKPIYSAKRDAVMAALQSLALEFSPTAFLSILRPLRLGWMHHRHIGFVRGLLCDPEDVGDRRFVEISYEWMEHCVQPLEFLEDIYGVPDRAVAMFRFRRDRPTMVGVAFKCAPPTGEEHLVWAKCKDLLRVMCRMERQCADALGARP